MDDKMTSFCKTVYKKEIVFSIEQKSIDDSLIYKIIKNIPSNKKIGLNMENVQQINSPLLIKLLLDNKIKLFNLQNEALAYLALTLKDGFLKSFINYQDFSENKRELIKRHFLVA